MLQGEVCGAERWCDCTGWTHLQEPAAAGGRRGGGGSSHPGAESCAGWGALVCPTGVSLVGFS